MTWRRIVAAAVGHPRTIDRFVRRGRCNDVAALSTLLLLEEAPHPAAALVAAARFPSQIAPLVRAALAPHVAPALAAWRADPQWPGVAVGAETRRGLTWGVAGVVGALRADHAARSDAVDIVLRNGDLDAVARCLDALGADGWAALDEDRRSALLARAAPDDLSRVWSALNDAQRETTVQRAASDHPSVAADCIGRIGAAAWRATDPALRRRLIDVVADHLLWAPATAPAWAGMTDDERAVLATAVIEHGDAPGAVRLFDALGTSGRATLAADRRAALERRAMEHPAAWRILMWRAADAGWDALSAEARSDLLAATRRSAVRVAALLRAVGAAGWNAMRADERKRLAAVVRRAPAALFACPPALWAALAGAALPPATDVPEDAPFSWRAEDADADLDGLPAAHQAVVLALAPWRTEDAAKDSVRIRRLRAAWSALTEHERVVLVLEHPLVLATVAAAARRHGGASAVVAAVGATVGRFATATGGGEAARIVGAMLRTPDDWRAWMIAFAPTDGDPPDVGKAWRDAARRGIIADLALCARLAAKERDTGAPAHAVRRTGR